MQTAICSQVQNSGSPIPAAKASGGNGGDFTQTLAGIMRHVSVEPGGTGRKVHSVSDTAGGNEDKADTPDTGGGEAAALSQPLMASLIMAVQAGGAQASQTVTTAAGGEDLPSQDQTLNSGLAAAVPDQGNIQATSIQPTAKGADMPPALTGSGVIAQERDTQGMAAAAAGTGKQPDFVIDAGIPRVIPAMQAGTADESGTAQPDVKGGAFTASLGTQSADRQVNAARSMNLQTGAGTIADSVKASAFTTQPEAATWGQSAVKPQTPGGETQAGHDTAPSHTQSSQTEQQTAGVAAAGAEAKGAQSVAFKTSVFAVRAKDEPNASVSSVKPQTGVAKQGGAEIPRAVQSASGAKAWRGSGLAKDDDGGGRQTDAADGSTAINLFGVKTDQVSGDALKAKTPDVTDIARQLSDACRSAADQGKSEIRVHLSPETLGGINIKIVSQNGAISLQISADSRRTGEMLQSNLAALSRSMSENGVNMNKVEVYYSNGGAFDASAGSFGGRQQNFDGHSGAAAKWMPVAQAKDDIDPGLPNNGRMSIFA